MISLSDDSDEIGLNTAVKYVINLAAQLNDNLVTGEEAKAQFDDLRDELMRITAGAQLNGENTKFFGGAFKTRAIVDLAELYRLEKKKQGVVDYSDQVALAERIASSQKSVGDTEKARNKFVLLDEYQDTSYLQTRLLLALYQDHPVFAVGDPNQSIYGWRGASATNLNEFVEKFSTDALKPVVELDLPTSWRNPKVVLDVANIIAEPLAKFVPYQENRGLVATRVLQLKPNDFAGEGNIEVLWEDHALDEAKYVATWLAERMSILTAKGEKPTGAVILRKRALMQLFQGELEAAGLETHIVGLGGLMDAPEIIDLVSALKVVQSPNAGGELIRVLAGPRWRISAKDISRLHRWAKKIGRLSDSDLAEKADRSLGAEYEASLIDALDLLLDSKKVSLYGMSESSLNRLRDAAQLFRNLRQQTGLPLVEFVKHVVRELQLDIDLAANPRRSHPFSNLNAFNDIVSNYVGSSNGYLGAFLEWLEFEADPNKAESPAAHTEKGVVQILTVHAAKGLEWDYVAVGNVNSVDFPDGKGTGGWMTAGELPYPLRGDTPQSASARRYRRK